MKKKLLLDCTLRDGGYVNDWNFGHDVLEQVFERLISAKVDIVEVGFLDDRRPFDINRSIMPGTASVSTIWSNASKGDSMVVGMIDLGTCAIENLQPCSESFLDGIRVIFKKHRLHEASDYCKKVKALGYKVFFNCVSITSYSDEELLELTKVANELAPYALSMVDTYGLLHQDALLHIFDILDRDLNPDIVLAYHGHNNFQMGYANSLAILNRETNRDIAIDATLYGMGKSAGNTPIELMAMYMNERYDKHYDLSQLMESIDYEIMDCYRQSPWGYKPFYYVAAMNKCHPNYVSYLMNLGTLSIKSINEILSRLEGDKRLLYDGEYIDKLYLEFQQRECDDTADVQALCSRLKDQTVLLIGPGASITHHMEHIQQFIREEKPAVIAVNYFPDPIRPDYLFLTNRKRYARIHHRLAGLQNGEVVTIATSNVESTGKAFDFTLNYSNLIDPSTSIMDNSMVMLHRAMLRCQVKSIVLAGFDGYSNVDINYADTNMEYSFAKEKAAYLNDYANAFFASIAGKVRIKSLTPTRYKLPD